MKRSVKALILSATAGLLAGWLLVEPAAAQVTGRSTSGRTRVEGTVVDHTGEPLAGVIVRLENQNTATKSTKTKSDKKGRFSHPLVEFGEYKITYELEGYRPFYLELENRASDGTDMGSFGPLRFGLAKDDRTLKLEPSGLVKITLKMAPEAEYQELAMKAAEGGTESEAAVGKVTRRRHPAEEGRELFDLKNYQGALEKFNAALQESGGETDPNLHFAIARAQYELGQYDAAAASLRRVQELEKTPRSGLFYYQAMLASKAGRTQEALEFLQKEIDAGGPSKGAMLATKGSLLRDLGREAEAIAALEEAVALEPGNMNSLLTLGTLHARSGNQDKAEVYFQKAVDAGASKGQEGAVVFYNLGALNYNQKEFRTAAEAYERAIALRPKYAAAHKELGYTYWELNERRKAATHFQTYLDLQPKAGDREEIEARIMIAKAQG